MKKKLIIDFHYLRNTNKGFGQYCLNLAQHIAQQDLSDYDITFYAPKKWKKRFGNSVKHKTYYSFHKHFNLLKGYDVFHGTTHLSKIEPNKTDNTKFIYTIHDAIFSLFNRQDESTKIRHQKLQEKIDQSSALIYISNFTKETIQSKFRIPEHIKQYTIYNGNPFEGLQPKTSKNLKYPYLLSVGEFRGYKNQDKLIPMLSHLDKNIRLVFIGKCSEKKKLEILELAKAHNVEKQVEIKGIVSEESKIELYSNCSALVHPSLAEGYGLPVVEAMSFGKPVIISNNTALPEVGGNVAHYWEHYDSKYMADVVNKALEDYEKNIDVRTKELKEQASKFSWETAAKQYLEVYKDLLKT